MSLSRPLTRRRLLAVTAATATTVVTGWLPTAVAAPTAVNAAAANAAAAVSAAGETGPDAVVHLQSRGSVNLRDLARASQSAAGSGAGPEIRKDIPERETKREEAQQDPLPSPPSRSVTLRHPGVRGFVGLTHRDQRFADNGNQFSLEPPDLGLCAGNGYVFQQVNLALAVYDENMAQLAPTTSLNRFFGLASAIDRTQSQPIFGPFLSDPRCHYDTDLQRWFVVVLELDVDPYTGNFTGRTSLLFAVSQTSDPLGAYTRYSLDTTNNGLNGTPRRPNCPCLGDFPMIGFNRTGFFVSTREFPLFEAGFNGGLVYALSKNRLAAAAESGNPFLPGVLLFDVGNLNNAPVDRVQPTITSPGSAHPNNREYFLATTNNASRSARSLLLYQLSNTNSLDTNSPTVRLSRDVMPSQLYGDPPRQRQKPGPRPLGELVGEPLPTVDAGDASFRSSNYYTNGLLSNAIPTGARNGGQESVASAWFVVRPNTTGPAQGTVVRQGYVRSAGYDLSYPHVGVRADGTGVLDFSILGPKVYPSFGYTPFSLGQGSTGPVRIVNRGARPEDGLSCYEALVGPNPRCRWGDYSQAAVSGRKIFFSGEYIPDTARTQLANWGTAIDRLG